MNTESHDMFGMPDDEELRQLIMSQSSDDLNEHKWAKTLVEYVLVLENLNLRRGMSKDQAFKMAAEDVLELAEYRGGKVEYLPTGDALRTAIKHAEIFRKFNGRNVEQLAEDYGLTVIHIYRINRQQRALHISKRQGTLSFTQEG